MAAKTGKKAAPKEPKAEDKPKAAEAQAPPADAAFSLDADSVKNGSGMELSADANGETAFLLSERPVLVKAIPSDVQERLSLQMQGVLDSTGRSLKSSAQDLIESQKEKAGQEVEAWVDEKKESLFTMLKESFMEWLDEALNVEQFAK